MQDFLSLTVCSLGTQVEEYFGYSVESHIVAAYERCIERDVCHHGNLSVQNSFPVTLPITVSKSSQEDCPKNLVPKLD
jgi:hypothetical protein